MALPLDAFAGFAQLGQEQNGKLWAIAKLNVGGNEKYDWKGSDFEIPGFAFGGIVSDDGSHWILFAAGLNALDAKKGLFEFKVWKNGEDGAKGSFDKAAGEALASRFQADGSLTAINVDNIESLKALVSVLHELKLIVTPAVDGKIKATIKLAEGQYESLVGAYTVLLGFLVESKNEAPDAKDVDANTAAETIFGLGAMVLPVLSEADIPGIDVKNAFGKVTGRNTYCFPFEGELPFVTPMFTAPKVEKKSSNGKSGKGGYDYDPMKSLNARRDFIVQEFKALNPEIQTVHQVFLACTEDVTVASYYDFLIKVMGK